MVRNDASHDRDENDHTNSTNGQDGDIGMMNDPSNNNNKNNSNETDLLIPTGGSEHDVSAKKRGSRKVANGTTSAIPGRRKVRKVTKGTTSATEAENAQAICIKYSALFLLVAQMVGLVLLMRYSRTSKRDDNEPLYLASTAVFVMEVMKLVICFGVVLFQTGSISSFISEIHHHVIGSPIEMIKLCVPSLLYTVQNNLLYLALTNLDAATYQVCYQLKILTTALFSALLLQRTFSITKWISLVVLTVGVAIVQLSGSSDQHSSSATHSDHHDAALEQADQVESHNRYIGLVAVICAACTSGFSGVYFEKILKGSRTSLWIRNVQMGLPSVLIAYITVYFKDAAAVKIQGFLGGYNTTVWTVIVVQAVGGLIVATVVKYADNVLKVFATSFSIIISCIISAFLFDFHPSFSFLVGASLVVTATVMYSAPEQKPRRKSILPTTRAK